MQTVMGVMGERKQEVTKVHVDVATEVIHMLHVFLVPWCTC